MNLETTTLNFVNSPWVKAFIGVGLVIGVVATTVAFVNSHKNRKLLNLDLELRKLQIDLIKTQLAA